jgi:gliding motility-associated-like protein
MVIPKHITRFLFVILFLFGGLKGLQAQDCSFATSNYMCAENPILSYSMTTTPFNYGCMNLPMSYVFSLNTGSNPAGSLDVQIAATDCDDFNGPNDITVMAIQVPDLNDPANPQDPCDQSAYISSTNCITGSGDFIASFSGLAPNADYLIVVASDHDIIYGPCDFDVSVSGTAIDLVLTAEPFVLILGETATITASGGEPGSSYQWTPAGNLSDPNSAVTEVTPESTTTYTVQSTIGDCQVTEDITLTISQPVVPYTGFTPNGDGINDGWEILNIQRYEDALVNVYDRWGQNVYRSLGYGKPWDGTNKGKYLPAGPYYFVIELNSPNVTIPPIMGVVSIIH